MTLQYLRSSLRDQLADTVTSIDLYNQVVTKNLSPLPCSRGDTKESLSETIHDVWSVKAKLNVCGDLKTKVVYLSCLCTIVVSSCGEWLKHFKDLPKRPRDFYMDVFEEVLKCKKVGYVVKPLLCRYINFNKLLIELHSSRPTLVPSNIAYMNVEGFMHEHIEDQLFVIKTMRSMSKASLIKAYSAVRDTALVTRKRERETFVERSFTIGKALKVQDMTVDSFNECVLVNKMAGVEVSTATANEAVPLAPKAVDDDIARFEGVFD